MREIKFRAWNVEEKIMCYDNEDDSACYWDGVVASNVGLINGQLKRYEGYKETYEYMQYTGLKDHNDVDIYERDIVQFVYGERPEVSSFDGGHDVVDGWTKDEFLEVKFVRGSFMIGKHLLWALEEMPFDYSLKVVGNIYQDRELLNQN